MIDAAHDALEGIRIFVADERGDDAVASGASGSADTMNVVFHVERHVVVDDVTDVIDVETTRGDVCGHQHANLTVAEAFHHLVADGLVVVAGKGGHGHVLNPKFAIDVANLAFGIAEDDESLVFRAGLSEELVEHAHLAGARNAHGALGRGGDGGDARRSLHLHRLLHQLLGVLQHLVGNGGAEQRRLAFRREALGDAHDVVDETHVEQAVEFVEDEGFNPFDGQKAILQEIDQTSRRSHDDLAAGDAHALSANMLTSDDEADLHAFGFAEGLEAVADLTCEFAGGADHETLNADATRFDAVHHRDAEGEGLAGAGFRLADDVASGEEMRNGFLLNFGGFGKAELANAFGDRFGESECVEIHVWSLFLEVPSRHVCSGCVEGGWRSSAQMGGGERPAPRRQAMVRDDRDRSAPAGPAVEIHPAFFLRQLS